MNIVNRNKNIENKNETSSDDELKFILWAAELNKELSSFWNAMIKKQ